MAKSRKLKRTITLCDIRHLFEEPDLSPFSAHYADYSSRTGLDYIVAELYSHPRTERIELTVLLPPDKITPDLESETLRAIQRYSDTWSRDAKLDLAETRYKGKSTLVVGIISFFVLNSLGLWLNQLGGLWFANLGDAAMVVAWILPVFSVELLTVGAWQHRVEKRAYAALKSLNLVVEPEAAQQVDLGSDDD